MKTILKLISLLYASSSFGEIYRIEAMENTRFWSFGIGLEDHYYGTDQMPIKGLSQVTTIGYGHLQSAYYWKAGGFLSSGPMDPVFQEKLILDSSSKGLFGQYGYSLFTKEMRGSYSSGPLLGIRQTDFSSTTLGSRQEITDLTRRNYSLSTKYASLNAEIGLFYCKAKPSRPIGNRPDLLTTRIEAWNFQISAVIPLVSKFQGELKTSDLPSYTKSTSTVVKRKTRLEGYSILMHLDAWFGG